MLLCWNNSLYTAVPRIEDAELRVLFQLLKKNNIYKNLVVQEMEAGKFSYLKSIDGH